MTSVTLDGEYQTEYNTQTLTNEFLERSLKSNRCPRLFETDDGVFFSNKTNTDFLEKNSHLIKLAIYKREQFLL